VRIKIFKGFGIVALLLILATTGYLAWNARYIEALAFWGVCSVLMWFLVKAVERGQASAPPEMPPHESPPSEEGENS